MKCRWNHQHRNLLSPLSQLSPISITKPFEVMLVVLNLPSVQGLLDKSSMKFRSKKTVSYPGRGPGRRRSTAFDHSGRSVSPDHMHSDSVGRGKTDSSVRQRQSRGKALGGVPSSCSYSRIYMVENDLGACIDSTIR
nr:hypothetical protein CFP56_11590 [Quercus suber]